MHAIEGAADFVEAVHLDHQVYAAGRDRALEQRQRVVPGVVAMEEVDALLRLGRIGGETHLHQVGETEAEDVLVEIQAALEVRRWQHRMAHAQVAGDEGVNPDRRDKAGEVLARAPEQLMAIAVRVLEACQGLHLAVRDFSGAATLDLHVGLFQLGDGLLERRRTGQLPTTGTIAITLGTFDQQAVGTLVHLQQQGVGVAVDCHHAQHVGGVVTPLHQVTG
jgi:hypothetical protein